jgi:hypothetical protein
MKTHAFETYREKYENVRMKREDGIRGHLRIGGTRLITRALPTWTFSGQGQIPLWMVERLLGLAQDQPEQR